MLKVLCLCFESRKAMLYLLKLSAVDHRPHPGRAALDLDQTWAQWRRLVDRDPSRPRRHFWHCEGSWGAFVIEAEESLRLYTSTLKLHQDRASKQAYRSLFRDRVTFGPCSSFIVSTSVKVSVTTVDEGLQFSSGVVS